MKNLLAPCLFFAAAACFAACGGSGRSDNPPGDSVTRVVPPPADNANATNPSVADTAYPVTRDTLVTKGDSARRGK